MKRGPSMYEMQGPRTALRPPASRLLDCPAPPDRPRSCPRDRHPSLVVSEFLQRRPNLAQGVSASNSKILWSPTGHRQLSPAPDSVSTALSTGLSTACGRARLDSAGSSDIDGTSMLLQRHRRHIDAAARALAREAGGGGGDSRC